MPQSPLSPVVFTAAEAAAVAVVLASEPQVPFAADGASILDKILGAMNSKQRQQATETARRIWMMKSTLGPRSRSARVLDEALNAQMLVLIDYADADGRITINRLVEPMAFIRTSSHWQLLAWCHKRRAGRWFRLDRVLRATVTRQKCADRDLSEVFGEPPEDAQPVVLPVAASQC